MRGDERTRIVAEHRLRHAPEAPKRSGISIIGTSASGVPRFGRSCPALLPGDAQGVSFSGVRGQFYGRSTYATSPDGITWTKYLANPVLTLGAAGAFDDVQVAEPRVLNLGTEYRMYFTGEHRDAANTQFLALGMAASPDGIAWTKDAANPILPAGVGPAGVERSFGTRACGSWHVEDGEKNVRSASARTLNV